MDKLGIQSLNAGAPDLRLSGDQTQRGTYTQRRRNQMAYGGIAGLDGRMKYGIGSWFQKAKDKVVDDFIPNEIKENPMAAAALLGGAANYMDLSPDILFGKGSTTEGWIGDLLGGAGNMLGTGARTVGKTLGIPGAENWFTGGIMPTGSGMDYGIDDAGLGVKINPATGLPQQYNWKDLLQQQVKQGVLGVLPDEAQQYLQT